MFHRKGKITAVLTFFVLALPVATFAQDDNANATHTGNGLAGKEKSQLCQGCHGVDGNSLSEFVPKLAGQNPGYIAKQVHNFHAGTRKHAIMNDLAFTVTDDDIIDIAEYFSSLKKMQGDGSAGDGIGRELFQHGDPSRNIDACVGCHGQNGKGLEPNPEMIPVIGGQNKDYLLRQLANFRKGDRTNSPSGVMNRIAKPLSDAEIGSLAAYISGR